MFKDVKSVKLPSKLLKKKIIRIRKRKLYFWLRVFFKPLKLHDNIQTDQNHPQDEVTTPHHIVWCGV